ncbi:MAG: 2OG-Fe(II) oxygenase [Gammaproteobacteria bacterium]
MQATRRHSIEEREVRVYDDLLAANDIRGLTAAFEGGAFTRNEFARPETASFRHWVLNIPLETANRLPVYQPTLAAAEEFCGQVGYRIYRCYCNHAAYGDMLFTHTDTEPGTRGLTALWFIAPEWNVEWGGETLFFDSNMDAQVAVSPRPGRLVLFDGSLTHAGRPPNRICYAPRYTLAFKLELQI